MTDHDTKARWQRLTERTAEAYEQHLVPLLFAPGAHFLTEMAGLTSGESVLDVGVHGRVVGLDLSPNMLKVAQSASAGILPPIAWQQGDGHDLPFPENTFDVLFCQQGLQFLQDRVAALAEMHRVLVPNGRIALSVLRSIEHNPGWAIFVEVLTSRLGTEVGAIMTTPFPDLNMDQLRDLMASAGFRDIRILLGIAPLRYPSARTFFYSEIESWLLAEPLARLGDEERESLISDLASALQIYTDDEGIVFPTETYLAVAIR